MKKKKLRTQWGVGAADVKPLIERWSILGALDAIAGALPRGCVLARRPARKWHLPQT